MKYVVRKADAHVSGEHAVSTFTEYESPFESFSVGISEINGKYPAESFDVDTEVDASWYVASGKGRIFVGGEVHEISEGDMIFVPKNEKFWIEGEHLKLVVTSSPPWRAEQHKHIS